MTTDPFLKHVPDHLRSQKTGERVLLFAAHNVAGQPTMLMRLLNECTIHAARVVILQDDYIGYDRDVVIAPPENFGREIDDPDPVALTELRELVARATFFHICQKPIDLPGVRWSDHLTRSNSLVQYFGSDIRREWPGAFEWHARTGILGLSAWDYTMLQQGLFFYHIPLMVDPNSVRECDPVPDEGEGPVRICHAPTIRNMKGTDEFLSAIDELRRDGIPLELELIEGVTNEECLRIKRTCQMTFDQISAFGIYGRSAIESMLMGHTVLCSMSNFAMSRYPHNPVEHVTQRTTKRTIRWLVEDRVGLRLIGEMSRDWAMEKHNPWTVISKYLWFYDLVMRGHRLIEDPDEYFILGEGRRRRENGD